MPCGQRKSVDQYQGLLIWRADLAENKEGAWASAAPIAPPKRNPSVFGVS
jgi:hypothetical protein